MPEHALSNTSRVQVCESYGNLIETGGSEACPNRLPYMVKSKAIVKLMTNTTWRTTMSNLSRPLRQVATQLASGPSFLLLGDQGLDLLGPVARNYHWNGIYTTATSPAVAEAFANESRVSTSLGAMDRTPSRSQSDLEVRYLFGGTHLPESSHRRLRWTRQLLAKGATRNSHD